MSLAHYVALVAEIHMSKHVIDDDDVKGDFWKKMRYGAAAAVTLGSGIYAVTSVLKKQGFSNIVDEVKTAMQTAPHLMADTTPKLATQPDDEQRAVLNMQLKFAMERQDMERVQEISRQLDKLEANVSTTKSSMMMSQMQASPMQQMSAYVPSSQTMHSQQMQMPSSAHSPMHMAPLQMPIHQTTPQQMPVHQMAAMASQQMPVHQMASQQMPVQQMASPQTASSQTVSPQMLVQQMAVQQMASAQLAPAQGGTPPLDKTSGDTATQREVHKESRPSIRKPIEPTPRQAAMQMLQAGDIVEAMDPVTTKWSPATIRAFAKNGLVEVRWDNPGMDDKGRPFHPIGEVWAEQIRLKWRPAPVALSTPLKTAASTGIEEEPVTPPDGLQLGDSCYAIGQVVTKNWFAAKLIGIRARSPPMRIEYMATLDGKTTELLLPSVRKDYVNVDQIRRDKPEVESTEVSRRAALEEKEAKALEEKEAKQASQNDDEDNVVISPDLMCVVCERPDDEPNMLVCDCKKGFHIYCLSPPLEMVPDGDWKCPKCAKKK